MSAKLMANSYGNAVRVRTGRVRLSYPHLFERDQKTGKFGAKLLIPKDDKDTIALIKEAEKNAKEDGISRVWGGTEPKSLKDIVNDGDKSDNEEDAGMLTINAKSNRRLVVYDKDGSIIDDEEDIYAGCWVQAIIEFFPYNNQSKGISCTLEGIKKVKDDEKLGGGGFKAGADDFDDDGDEDDDLI